MTGLQTAPKFKMDQDEATEKYQEYLNACKVDSFDNYLNDMKRIYHALKDGKVVMTLAMSLQLVE